MVSETSLALNEVLNFLGKTPTVKTPTSTVLPTAKTRSMLNLLAGNTAESLLADQVNLRPVAEGLFNWSGERRATKNVIRALNEALNTPGKYQHTVELCGYLAAMSPMLEPDRLARMFKLVNQTATVFGPAKYTLQLNQRLTRIFEGFNPERVEKLASSLWVQSHTGRWWDITAGQALDFAPANEETFTVASVTRNFKAGELAYVPALANILPKVRKNETIREIVKQYSLSLDKGHIVDPDVALISSFLPWLNVDERPESPVGSLVDSLISVVETTDWVFPEKPQKFSDLFPNIRLYGNGAFPFADNIFATNARVIDGVRFELVHNAAILAENRTYMGNCTWSYKNRMEAGQYVLYRLHYQDHIYNASMVAPRQHGAVWRVQEINSRHNRGNVPNVVREAFNSFVRNVTYDEQTTLQRVELLKQAQGTKRTTEYKFQV